MYTVSDGQPPHVQYHARPDLAAYHQSVVCMPASLKIPEVPNLLATPRALQPQPSKCDVSSNRPFLPTAFPLPSNSTSRPSELASSSPDIRSSPCPPYRKSRLLACPLSAIDKERHYIKAPLNPSPIARDVMGTKHPKSGTITLNTNISQSRIKTEPSTFMTSKCSDSANQTAENPSEITTSCSKAPFNQEILEDLRRIWDANPSVPTAASRKAWAEARGLHRTRVHNWFTNKRGRERLAGRPHTGTYELPVDAPVMLGASKPEAGETPIPQVSSKIGHTGRYCLIRRR
jgi:Homeodomain